MYAVIQTGGKQYRAQPGDVIEIEKVTGAAGEKTKFDEVLLVAKSAGEGSSIWLGKPTLAGASVEGEVISQGRGDKVLIVKMKRRKQYRRTQGHRQELTHVLVTGISNGSGESATLSAEDRKTVLAKFQSHLTPKYGKQAGEMKAAADAATLKAKANAPRDASAAKAPKASKLSLGDTPSTKKAAPKKAAAPKAT